jgi:hypothetical protein
MKNKCDIFLEKFRNCASRTEFSSPVGNSLSATSPAGNPGGGTICSPFTGGASASNSQNGILSSITYILPTSPVVSSPHLSVASFAAGGPDVQSLNQKIIMDQFDIPTQDFTDGFELADGSKLKGADGQILDQYFSLHSTGMIGLASSNAGVTAAGSYQFAVLSDDGAIFSASEVNGNTASVQNDGNHNDIFACSSHSVNLQPGAPVSFQMDYYQGPPQRLALILLWRKVDPNNPATLQDTLCGSGTTGHGTYFFAPDSQGVPQPTANYNAILSHGWQVVPSANFVLPAGTLNSCN